MNKLVVLLFFIINAIITPASAQYNLYKESDNVNLLNYINLYRESRGLPKVIYDPGLEEAARLQVLDNYIKKKFRKGNEDVNKLHQNSRFPQVRDRVSAVGVPVAGEACAEICYAKVSPGKCPLAALVKPYQSLEQLMFMRYKGSPGHHAIMVSPAYSRVGIHTIYDGKYVYNAVVFMTGKQRKSYSKL